MVLLATVTVVAVAADSRYWLLLQSVIRAYMRISCLA
jgi:hypothetical protein